MNSNYNNNNDKKRTIVDDLCDIKLLKDDYYKFQKKTEDEIKRLQKLNKMASDDFAKNKAVRLNIQMKKKRLETLEKLVNLY